MLDADTKRRIDSARDILVGKVPDPKSQVEQITIALIYKFMDDMDAEAEELGGERSFFSGAYTKYGWAKLMDRSLGGHEMLALYAEAIMKMTANQNLPELFRDIFKNAFLPYRDPETLRAFLKEIDKFSYDHSERLGDAFEYLLSVLGSQGDAGQFRTPRHIIDFMVEVIDPKKDETVLDPACGTAGFLISAYKHVLRQNRDAQGNSTLTPDDRTRLATNYKGYDISPDMVRLSLVNLYLHGFTDPHVFEYDSLTSEERWNEFADVILANPPFMSPKGGIKPHKRFSIQAKRSEVLFVDYMAEHLSPQGRAAIIVPEGIIFQSQTAYKALRKMLVETCLVAVVSLPAGCFNPYSGVKTSILIFDKALAKKSDTLGFFKVENDGFGLGAQRRAIDKNDLPQVKQELEAYLQALQSGGEVEELAPTCGLIVPKAKVTANGEYNLSGERYREGTSRVHEVPLVAIGDVCAINPRKSLLSDMDPQTRVSFVPMADLNEHRMRFTPSEEKALSEVTASYTYFEDNDVLLAKVTPCFENGKAGIARGLLNGIGFGSSEFYVMRPSEQVLPEWIYFCVMHPLFRDAAVSQMTGTGGLQRVPRQYVADFQIPLPPLEVQKEIVAEIEGYQKVIDGARSVLDHYRPHIPIDPEWPEVPLQEITDSDWGNTTLTKDVYVEDGAFLGVSAAGGDGRMNHAEHKRGTLVLSAIGANCGRMFFPEEDFTAIKNTITIAPYPKRADARFLFVMLSQKTFPRRGAGQPFIAKGDVLSHRIPLPSLEVQQAIAAEIEAEQALVAANRELIARFEKKIQATLARVWGEEPTTDSVAA